MPVSTSVVFNEHDFLDAAGVWTQYESLLNNEKEVDTLKRQKSRNSLIFWMRRQTEWGNCDKPIATQEQMQELFDAQEKAYAGFGDL